MRILSIILLILTSVDLCEAPSYAEDYVTAVRSYPIPNHGVLVMPVPQQWKQTVRQGPKAPLTVEFSAAAGDDFKVLVSPLWSPTNESGFNSPQTLRTLLENVGRRSLKQAVEPALKIQEFHGASTTGLFFSLTDRAPKPDEYKYMTQGDMAVGPLLVTFTILYRVPSSAFHHAALEMLRNASHRD